MSINKNLFQRVQGIMLTYDISNEESFNHLNKWIEHIKENSSGSPVILIGNKSDLEKERKVSKENGETFAKSHNLLFFEASAKNGTNVNESFLKLGEIIIKDEKFIENRDKNKTEYVISKNTSKKTKKKCC
jgi:small GTP-binding protein